MIRIELAKKSLDGGAIGDAFGDSFFGERSVILEHINQKTMPETKWEFTDDTVMSLAVYEQLEKNGKIIQDELIERFAKNLELDPIRGYGATVRRLLREYSEGGNWKTLAQKAFDGMGSMGNGAAMRAPLIGAYFYDNYQMLKTNVHLSAEVTHANHEAVQGACSVALGAAILIKSKIQEKPLSPVHFLEKIAVELEDSDVKSKIIKATKVSKNYRMESVRSILGNGEKMLAQDTVPLVLWCTAHYHSNYAEALWKGVSALGDRDTICSMIGALSILTAPAHTVPESWSKNVESADESIFRNHP